MNISDVSVLSESYELECKLAAGRDGKGELPKDFWPSYSALANTSGGIVLLGVKEKKGEFSLNSIEKPELVLKDLFDAANNPTKVSICLLTNDNVSVIEIDGHTIIKINIPRATRQQRPVYLKGNPLGNTYLRRHEADHSLPDEEVKLMLSEQQHDSLDDTMLPKFGFEDLSMETLRVYRQTHTNLKPDHIWSGFDDLEFLKAIGGWKVDRNSSEEGLTKAGLLMFGSYRSIKEVFPNFFLDYLERPTASADKRWIDRITFDGSWSGNLYDFYLKVYPKLVADIKIPFEIKDGLRQEDTPIHIALREALANTLVHADYRDRAKVYIVKRPDMFGFLNPGLMRIPAETAIQGYESDCRNRTLHEMFSYVNIGERSGTGVQRIYAGWKSKHLRKPILREDTEPNNRTVLELHTLDLFEPGILDILRLQYKDNFESLDQITQLALAITLSEGRLTHSRLCELSSAHAADVSKTLRQLVDQDYLTITGNGRGAVYRFKQVPSTSPEDVFGNDSSTVNDISSSTIKDNSSTISSPSSTINDSSSTISNTVRDEFGRIITDKFVLPFIDSVDELSGSFTTQLKGIAKLAHDKQRLNREDLACIILKVSKGHYITIKGLAEIVNRGERTLRQDYIPQLCKEGRLKLAFRDTPNHESQAYTTV